MNNRRKTDSQNSTVEKPLVMIAAGGSGGHIVPGLSIAKELKNNGFDVIFLGVPPKFEDFVTSRGCQVISLPTPQYMRGGIFGKISALWAMAKAVLKSVLLFQKYHPTVVVGMGGFTSVAALIGASMSGVPTAEHEQNVIAGRANKFMAPCVDKIMISFEKSKGFFSAKIPSDKFVVTGYPVRDEVLEKMTEQKSIPKSDMIKLVITGGSMGSSIVSDVAYEAVCKLPENLRSKLEITHQARDADKEKVMSAYKDAGVKADVNPFFDDLPDRMIAADLLISRSGMGSVAEAAAFSLPSILIPHRLADNHQLYNAEVLTEVGGALLMEEPKYTADNLADVLELLLVDEKKLAEMAKKAHNAIDYTAAQKCAQEIMNLAEGDMAHQVANLSQKDLS